MSDSRIRILLVEDNATIRDAFGILLEDVGYEVDQASSGEEAIQRARSNPPHLILMDLGLPDVHGLEITRKLKSDPVTRDVVVVAITGRALETDRAACIAAGCAGYLTKPVNAEELLGSIPMYLGNSSQ